MRSSDFWTLALVLGVPGAGIAVLYLLARQGEVMAIVALAVFGAMVLIGSGILATLAIMDRAREAEQIRFAERMYETQLRLTFQERQRLQQAELWRGIAAVDRRQLAAGGEEVIAAAHRR